MSVNTDSMIRTDYDRGSISATPGLVDFTTNETVNDLPNSRFSSNKKPKSKQKRQQISAKGPLYDCTIS